MRLNISLSIILAFALALVVGSAKAQMTTLGAGGSKASAALPGPPVLTYIGNQNGTSHAGNVETYTSVPIGVTTGFTTRRIIFVIQSNNLLATLPIVSFVINGTINATQHVAAGSAASQFVAIYSADVPTGTTCNIAVTFSGSVSNDQWLSVYTVDDALLVSTTPQTGSATASTATSITSSSFTQSSSGFNIAGVSTSGAATGVTTTGYTQDTVVGSLDTAASKTGLSAGSATFTATWTNSDSAATAVTSWR